MRGPKWAPTPPVDRGCSPPLVKKMLNHPQTARAHILLHLFRNIYRPPAIYLFFFLLPIKYVSKCEGKIASVHTTKHM